MDTKTRSIHMMPTKGSFQNQRCTQTEGEGKEKTYSLQMEIKRVRVAILLSDITVFKSKETKKDTTL